MNLPVAICWGKSGGIPFQIRRLQRVNAGESPRSNRGRAHIPGRKKGQIYLLEKDEYARLFPEAIRIPEGDAIPHEVVGLTIKKGYTLVHAWREYLRLTQTEVAERMGITQAALSQMEAGRKHLRKATLEKLAAGKTEKTGVRSCRKRLTNQNPLEKARVRTHWGQVLRCQYTKDPTSFPAGPSGRSDRPGFHFRR